MWITDMEEMFLFHQNLIKQEPSSTIIDSDSTNVDVAKSFNNCAHKIKWKETISEIRKDSDKKLKCPEEKMYSLGSSLLKIYTEVSIREAVLR